MSFGIDKIISEFDSQMETEDPKYYTFSDINNFLIWYYYNALSSKAIHNYNDFVQIVNKLVKLGYNIPEYPTREEFNKILDVYNETSNEDIEDILFSPGEITDMFMTWLGTYKDMDSFNVDNFKLWFIEEGPKVISNYNRFLEVIDDVNRIGQPIFPQYPSESEYNRLVKAYFDGINKKTEINDDEYVSESLEKFMNYLVTHHTSNTSNIINIWAIMNWLINYDGLSLVPTYNDLLEFIDELKQEGFSIKENITEEQYKNNIARTNSLVKKGFRMRN